MTSAVGGGRGSPKSRQKEQNQLTSVCDKGGGGGQKIRRHIWKPPMLGGISSSTWVAHST